MAGSSQAIAFTSATCSGGKTARAPRARSVLEPLQALLMKAPSPAADDPRRGVEPRRDLNVGLAFGRVENDPCPLDLAPGALLRAGDPLKLRAVLVAELDLVAGWACHAAEIRRGRQLSFKNSGQNFWRCLLVLGSRPSQRAREDNAQLRDQCVSLVNPRPPPPPPPSCVWMCAYLRCPPGWPHPCRPAPRAGSQGEQRIGGTKVTKGKPPGLSEAVPVLELS